MAMATTFYINDKLMERIQKALDAEGIALATFVESALDAALWKQEERNRRRPKEHRPKNPVGRPRISAQERQFRETVRMMDEIYLRLENDFVDKPDVFDELFGLQLAVYKAAVVAKDHAKIEWWWHAAPWQKKNPDDFKLLYATRAS